MKIAVWDDELSAATKWKDQLVALLGGLEVTVDAPEPAEIVQELRVLHDRRKEYLESDSLAAEDVQSKLDDTDILIVDNDLFDLPDFSDFSAETVAARAGVYTRCGYIVVLNLSPDVDFDLTLLGNPRSKADLHINDRFVANEGLWQLCPNENGRFRPWSWPLLLNVVAPYQSRVEELESLLEGDESNKPILDHLCFGQNVQGRLSRSARAFLHPKLPVNEVSFRSFVDENANAVGVKDGQRMLERNDVRKLARVGARRVAKWLSHLVLSPQDVVMDFPHLVERMPFVIPVEQRNCIHFWNSCARLCGSPMEVVEEKLGIGQADFGYWHDRPVFWTEAAETDENLDRMLGGVDANPQGFVFCEDASSFHEADGCDEFVAAHNSMMDGRFVRWFGEEEMNVKYGPQSRLAR